MRKINDFFTCRVSKGMMVSNAECLIPQRLATGLNANGALDIFVASASISSANFEEILSPLRTP